MKYVPATTLLLFIVAPVFSQKKDEKPVPIDPAVWARSAQTYEGKLVTFKGVLSGYFRHPRNGYCYYIRTSYTKKATLGGRPTERPNWPLVIEVYFNEDMKRLRDRWDAHSIPGKSSLPSDRFATVVELKGRVKNTGPVLPNSQAIPFVIEKAELIKLD